MGRADLKLSPRVRRVRRFWRALPSPPRCKMCTSPFGPPAGPLLRLFGKGRWAGNSDYCAGCFKQSYRNRDHRRLDLRGKADATDVIVVTLGSPARI